MVNHDVRDMALRLQEPSDLDPLLERIGDARFVLLGEASHGTHEYYDWRAAITRRLIRERGFSFVAVEGDWPDCYAVNRCVKHAQEAPANPREVLDRFERWPTWMWANDDVVAFAEWLRDHNAGLPAASRVGFYGLDVYSLWESMREILDYLSEHEPEHVETALQAWRCFEPYGEDPQEYAWATRFVPTSCEDTVIALLRELRHLVLTNGRRSDDPEEQFDAEQNALVAAGAERYYRAMIRGNVESWNVRDRHMADTLDRLMAHHGPGGKAVVWEHNTHIGDARATDMARSGMVNVGQLVREQHADEGVVLVGFGGYRGSVIAADGWGETMRRLPVPPAREGSLEDILHRAGCGPSLFVFAANGQPGWTAAVLPHRAIGVVYRPERERFGNYVPTVVGQRYDAFCFFDDTRALRPLHMEAPQPHKEHATEPAGL
jgi:erythromycin esterase